MAGDVKMGRSVLGMALFGVSYLALSAGASAQEYAQATQVTGVTVEAERSSGVERLPQPIEDQPQSVHVIDEETLREQAVTTLDQAVRNIPGITANTGEGGGATAGDQFRIRGFDAQNDIASDGLRDFGVYTRDSFNVEAVQVFLGPSGSTFGRGSFGGAINTTSKFARLEDFTTVVASAGTANLLRGTLDANRQLGENTAVRLNVMGHQSEFADIDNAESNRWGASAAIGFGLSTNTSFEAMYFHQSDDRVPYYGVPVVAAPGDFARPLPVDRSTFYGTEHDRDETQADVVTTKLTHRFNDGFRIHNDTRVGVHSREFMAVAPNCNNTAPSTCLTDFFDGNPATVPFVTRGGASGPYYLDQWGVQNITTAIADFETGGLRHQLVAGVDLTFESATRLNSSATNAGTFPRPPVNAYDPSPVWANPAYAYTNERDTESRNAAVFVSEQLWFTDAFSVLAGLRLDHYSIESTLTTFGAVNSTTGAFTPTSPNTVARTEVSDDLFSPRVSFIYEPSESTLFYLSFARSAQPATGTASASVGTPITAGQEELEPTTSETIELGGRIGVLNDRLRLSAAIFQTERDNAKETDPTTGGIIAAGDQQQARGFEIGAEGFLTDAWSIQTSYTYLDTETELATAACSTAVGAALPCPTGVTNGSLVPNPAAIGNPIPFAAEHAATIWTTYEWDAFTFGVGGRYTDEVWLNNTNTAIAPEYISLDALVSYAIADDLVVQINGTNLLDREDNYDQVVGGRAAHAPGRAFVVSLQKTF